MSKEHKFRILGIPYRWKYARLRGTAIGWTYFPELNDQRKAKILVDERLKGRARLNVEIHEFLHAANPTHSEEHVTEQANDLSRILWLLGYRRQDDSR